MILCEDGLNFYTELWQTQNQEISMNLIWLLGNTCESTEAADVIFKSNVFKNYILPFIEADCSLKPVEPRLNMDAFNELPMNFFEGDNSSLNFPMKRFRNNHVLPVAPLQPETQADTIYHLLLANILNYGPFHKYSDNEECKSIELRVYEFNSRFIFTTNKEVFIRMVTSFCQFFNRAHATPDFLYSANILPLLNNILDKKYHDEDSLFFYGNKLIGNYICANDDPDYALCYDYRFLDYERECFSKSTARIAQNAIWVLSNAVSDYGNDEGRIQRLLLDENYKGFLKEIEKTFMNPPQYTFYHETCKLLSVLVTGTTDELRIKFCEFNILGDFVEKLRDSNMNRDENYKDILYLILELLRTGRANPFNGANCVLENFKTIGGFDALNQLSFRSNNSEELENIINDILREFATEEERRIFNNPDEGADLY
ncbi:MAG: hypothetical protein MJ252_22835 [archaeon]|nr:hypothetical protein [archaeon]